MAIDKKEAMEKVIPIAQSAAGELGAVAAMLEDERLFFLAEMAEERIKKIKNESSF